jgi:hypothetical protein
MAVLGQEGDQPVSAPDAATQRKSAVTDMAEIQVAMIPERLEPRVYEPVPEDAFAVKAWAPPLPPSPPAPKAAPKPVAAVTPPKPEAPPLPLRYLGRLEEDGEITYFLAAGDKIASVKLGQELLGAYRLEAVNENTLTFNYMPMSVMQTLTVERQR